MKEKDIKKLTSLMKKFPDLRFGQFLGNALDSHEIYYISDDDFLGKLEETYNKNLKSPAKKAAK